MNLSKPSISTRIALKTVILLFFVICLPVLAQAQWTAPDSNGNINSTNSGNVGIGTASPTLKLHVVGNSTPDTDPVALAVSDPTNGNERITLGYDITNHWGTIQAINTGVAVKPLLLNPRGGTVGIGYVNAGATAALAVNGNVGIGTTVPSNPLTVAPAVTMGSGAFVYSILAEPVATMTANAAELDGIHSYPGVTGAFTLSQMNAIFADGASMSKGTSTVSTAIGLQLSSPTIGETNYGIYQSGSARNYFSGNVGIGTTAPNQTLEVKGWGRFSNPGSDAGIEFEAGTGGKIYRSATTGNLVITPQSGFNTVINAGNVGIGTNPSAANKLEVMGAIHASGAITGTTVSATYQDVAEWVPSTQILRAATVVILDPEQSTRVIASTSAYDTRVAGVISARPGLMLGETGPGKTLVATTGRVKVKVDATRAPIRMGDLLVTSDIPGMAMRSEALDLGGAKIHRPGTIIGKALEPLEKGTGEILVLLSLQ
jgi:hypothetical protein